ncbi:hypothetical protein CBS101457_003024 [Exobasidium rhododendri]|nr:hypothetical protein CBS101457_003024 [Exobasidium rhododendri]
MDANNPSHDPTLRRIRMRASSRGQSLDAEAQTSSLRNHPNLATRMGSFTTRASSQHDPYQAANMEQSYHQHMSDYELALLHQSQGQYEPPQYHGMRDTTFYPNLMNYQDAAASSMMYNNQVMGFPVDHGSSSSSSFGEPNYFVFADQQPQQAYSETVPLQGQSFDSVGVPSRGVYASIIEAAEQPSQAHPPSSDMHNDELCWDDLDDNAKRIILKLISKKTSKMRQSIQTSMAKKLTTKTAHLLLSNDKEQIKEGLINIYGRLYQQNQLWKSDMSEEEAELLVYRLVLVAEREAEDVRTFLSHSKISGQYARQLCYTNDEERRQFVMDSNFAKVIFQVRERDTNIIHREDPNYLPWMEGTYRDQRTLIVQTVKDICICTRPWALHILHQHPGGATDHIGLNFLRILGEEGPNAAKTYILGNHPAE